MNTPYDDMAAGFEAEARENAYNAHYDRPAVLNVVGSVERLRVLDAGCGPGLYSASLIDRGADVVAIDSSTAMIELAKARLGSSGQVLHADLDDALPFADEEFDVVLCALVIHHVADRRATLREFYRVLRPGGRAILSTQHPTADWVRKGGSYFDVREEKDVWEYGAHSYTVRFWREPLTSLCAAIGDAGFLIERLVEPLPDLAVRERWPDIWEELHLRPGFLVLKLLKPVTAR